MRPIRDVHVSEPGLVVIDVAAMDDATVFAVQTAIARMWAASPADTTHQDPGQPGVRLRLYADLRQVPDSTCEETWPVTTGGVTGQD
ncbi:DUF6207 family protein [Streptomyces sp. S1D4-11]|nr:DUF6207 family protein [Streptomyces sp. S1D4-11]QIY93058.1 hypothetical protein HEP87_00985 [Streptomyces sp. S1D4-11]